MRIRRGVASYYKREMKLVVGRYDARCDVIELMKLFRGIAVILLLKIEHSDAETREWKRKFWIRKLFTMYFHAHV